MKTVATLCVIVLFSFSVYAAESAKYWVVGSFKTMSSASEESERIASASSEKVEIAKFDLDSGTLYRLVVRQSADTESQRNRITNSGVEPWTASVRQGQLMTVSADTMAPTAGANRGSYLLVVGAFRRESMADAYRMQLSDKGAANPSVVSATSDGSEIHRVVLGPFPSHDRDAMREAERLGVSGAWWTTSSQPVQTASVTRAPEPIPGPEPEPEVAVEQVMEPAPLRAPDPNESYFDYCLTRATPRERERYCDDQTFSSVALSEQRVKQGARGQTYFDFCTKEASKAQRAKYCRNATFTDRVAPPM